MKTTLKHGARLALGWFFAAALRARSRVYTPGGPLVVVAPHPDDETLGCGGLVALLARRGATIRTVFLTDGEASHRGHPSLAPSALAHRRRAEALAALASLGILEPERSTLFLGGPDGRLDRLPAGEYLRLQRAITDVIRLIGPATVLAPYRLGGSTEHTAAYALTRAACAAAGGCHLLEYPIWAWWNPFRLRAQLAAGADNLRLPLDAAIRATKRRALACHRTQMEPTPPWPEPVLPSAIVHACLGPREFFFRQYVPAGVAPDVPSV